MDSNYKHWSRKEIEENTNKWKYIFFVHGLGELILLKMPTHYPKQYIDSMQKLRREKDIY